MSHEKIRWIVLIALVFLLAVSSVQAQIELDASYTSHDGSFSFNYPDKGQAQLDDESFVGSVQITVPLYEQNYIINVFSPWLTRIQIAGVQSLEMAKDILTQNMVSDETSFEINTIQSHPALEFFDETNGFWILIELDNGGYALIGVHAEAQRRTRLRDLARAIALSYSYSYPIIQNYAADWQAVIDELQNKAIIAERGNLVFSNSDSLTDWGQTWLIGDDAEHMNIVMSAEIKVTGNAHCGLMAHVQSRLINDAEETFSLRLMLNTDDSRSSIGYSDQFGVMSRAFNFVHMPIEANTSHHYLMITDDHALSIYVNGEPLVEHVPIAPVEGSYGLYFEPISADSHCLISNFWIYEHDLPITDTNCQAVITAVADGRLWPNDARTIQTIDKGQIILLTCHHVMDSGAIWYLLKNGLWVDSSKVRLIGDCGGVPTIY